MGAIPGELEVHVSTCILKLCGEVDDYGEGSVSITSTMTDILICCNGGSRVTYVVHRAHQPYSIKENSEHL